MNNNLTIDLQNVSDEDKKILMEIVKRSNAPKSKVWKPTLDDAVFFVDEAGKVYEKIHTHHQYWGLVYEQGNMFKTLEEAEFESERRKFSKIWRDLSIESGEAENKWDGKNKHWCCYCDDTHYKTINYEWLDSCKDERTYFATKESLEIAIKKIGEDNVKKYILGVKE